MLKFLTETESVALEQPTMTELVRKQDEALLAEDWLRVLICTALLARKAMGLFHYAATKADVEATDLKDKVARGDLRASDLDLGTLKFHLNPKQQNESGDEDKTT